MPISNILDRPSSAPRAEKKFWEYLNAVMKSRWDVQRHEDKFFQGIPDISYGLNGVNGWIELKVVDAWPTKRTTVVHPSSPLTFVQRNWLTRRKEHGGHCFIFLKVGREFILLDQWSNGSGGDAKGGFDLTWNQGELLDKCVGYWMENIDPRVLAPVLCRRNNEI